MADSRHDLVVARYGELFLKGANRGRFEQLLLDNVRRVLPAEARLERAQGRLFVDGPASALSELPAQLQRVFGLSSVSPAHAVPADVDAIAARALELVRDRIAASGAPPSFKIACRRADKRFPLGSVEVNRIVGARVVDATGLRVDLTDPALEVGVEIGPRRSFLFLERLPGAGGLPVGASGRVALLLSGGIDSPVAGNQMQKRGCRLYPIHFHSFPYTGERSLDKVRQLGALLAPAQGGIRLTVVPFTAVQLAIRDSCPPELAVVLYRRMMMRIASQIARCHGCAALTTGESLGQVASQTLENLACIEDAAQLPVLRPLLTHDKAETIALARRVGTYQLSIAPYEDCCSLFVPRHPATRARVEHVVRAERALDVDALARQAVGDAEQVELG